MKTKMTDEIVQDYFAETCGENEEWVALDELKRRLKKIDDLMNKMIVYHKDNESLTANVSAIQATLRTEFEKIFFDENGDLRNNILVESLVSSKKEINTTTTSPDKFSKENIFFDGKELVKSVGKQKEKK